MIDALHSFRTIQSRDFRKLTLRANIHGRTASGRYIISLCTSDPQRHEVRQMSIPNSLSPSAGDHCRVTTGVVSRASTMICNFALFEKSNVSKRVGVNSLAIP
jgi:hypothetical protein